MNWGYMLLPGMGGNNTLLMGNEGVIALLGERGGGDAVPCGGEWRESLSDGGRRHTSGGYRGIKQEGYKVM